LLSSSPLGSTSSSSSPPRPREPTNRFDVVVAGSSHSRRRCHAGNPPPIA
jgi:hypothetical protein